jgi:hypothetical protein
LERGRGEVGCFKDDDERWEGGENDVRARKYEEVGE